MMITNDEECASAYLQRRQSILTKIHPQWQKMDCELAESEKADPVSRRLVPICVPPTWDVIKRYAGAMPESGADGFNPQLYKRGQINFAGERGEAEFLQRMQAAPIGGILVGNIDSGHMIHGFELSAKEKRQQEHIMPTELTDVVKSVISECHQFEMDFVLIHPSIGIYHIEVKHTTNPENVEDRLKHGRQQIRRGILKKLFTAFCAQCGKANSTLLWERFYAGGGVYFAGLDGDGATSTMQSNTSLVKRQLCAAIEASEKLGVEIFYENVGTHFASKRHKTTGNLFDDKVFRDFAVFLTCYRPDFFLSPVSCVLQTHANIISQDLRTANFYVNKKATNRHNIASSVHDYLLKLQSRGLISRCDIIFPGGRNNMYFTAEQLKAVDVFDDDDLFTNTTQLIMGPPGSGKSLIIMLKLFVLTQIRGEIPLIMVTWKAHAEIIREFIYENEEKYYLDEEHSGFMRFTRNIEIIDEKIWRLPNHVHNHKRFDCILDEQYPDCLLERFKRNKAQPDPDSDPDFILTAVVTGGLHLITHGNHKLDKFVAPTLLRTSFRSTNCIQRYVTALGAPIPLISGHGFAGIPPEVYHIGGFRNALQALSCRVARLRTDLGSNFSSTTIALISEHPIDQNELANVDFFYHPRMVPSLEFAIVILFGEGPKMRFEALCASRAICHLIVFHFSRLG